MAVISEDIDRVIKGQQDFCIQLYKEARQTNENLVLCPTSMCAVLTMLGVGAKGYSAAQLADVLKLPSVDINSEVHESLRKLFVTVSSDNLDHHRNVDMMMANTMYLPEGCSIHDHFAKFLADKYLVSTHSADFRNRRVEAAEEINNWVANHTQKKIVNLVSPEMFDEQTRLVLINAVYMKGLWDNRFKTNDTSRKPFKLLDGSERLVDMMFQEGNFRFGYSQFGGILEMPYRGLEYAMDILLPATIEDFDMMEDSLSTENIRMFLDSMGPPRHVYLSLPRFQAEASLSLHEILPKLGIVDMFDRNKADFSGISNERLHVSKMLHKTAIEVDEEGSEATAATSAVLVMESFMQFRVDHPFLYFIRHIKTSAVLFLGRMTSPPESSAS